MRSPTRSSLTPGCDVLRQQIRGLYGLSAKAERCEADAAASREKVGEGAGWLPGVWKLTLRSAV